MTLRILIEHVELATLQRELAGWPVEDDVWRETVLSPWISGSGEDVHWRRMLWEHFYPRVRRETSPVAAAEIVARHVALRVGVVEDAATAGLRENWTRGVANRDRFEQLYVAALRSVGMPARMGSDGQAWFHPGDQWRPAPRPFSEALARPN